MADLCLPLNAGEGHIAPNAVRAGGHGEAGPAERAESALGNVLG